jgi:hypothetical protein
LGSIVSFSIPSNFNKNKFLIFIAGPKEDEHPRSEDRCLPGRSSHDEFGGEFWDCEDAVQEDYPPTDEEDGPPSLYDHTEEHDPPSWAAVETTSPSWGATENDNVQPKAVFYDEGGLLPESAMWPGFAYYWPAAFVLFGDERQLSPTVTSSRATNPFVGTARCLFVCKAHHCWT